MSFLSSTRNCTCATLGHSKGSITFYMEIGSKAKEMLDAFFTLFVGDLVKAVLKHFVEMKWFIITGRHFAWSGVRLLCRQTHTHSLTHSRESLSLFSLSARVIHSKSEKRHKRHVDQWTNRRKKYFFFMEIHSIVTGLRDGTGRHPGFRNQCTCACRFESDRRHLIC